MGENFTEYKKKSKKVKSDSEASLTAVFGSRLLPLYDNLENRVLESGSYRAYKFATSRLGNIFKSFKRVFSRSFENSFILGFFDKLSQRIFEKSLRYYGVGLFFFGFFYLAFTLVTNINRIGNTAILTERNILLILPGILTVIAASAMMISQKSLASQILQSKFLSFFLFDIFNFDRKHLEKIKPQNRSHTLPVIIGMSFGIASIFVSPVVLLKLFVYLISFILVMRCPENGIIGTCLVFPFVNNDILLGLLGLVAVSYFVKALRLKRVFKFGIMDAVLTVVSAIVFFCGINSTDMPGSFEKAVCIILCLLFGFIASNTIRTSRLTAKCLNSLLLSVSVAAFFSILSFVVNRYNLKNLNSFTEIILNFPSSFPFEKGGDIFEILVLFIPFVLSKRNIKGISAGTNSLIAFALLLGASFISFDTSVWFTAIVAIIIYICFMKPSFTVPAFITSTVILTLSGIFPKAVSGVSEFLGNVLGAGFDFRGVVLSNSIGFELLGKTTLTGIGMGEGAIENAIAYYYGSGFCGASENMSVGLRVLLELGVFGVLALLFAYITFFVYGYGIFFNEKIVSVHKPYIAASLSSVSAVFIRGLMFPSVSSLQSFFVLSIFIYICTSIKQSALSEYVPKVAEINGDSY